MIKETHLKEFPGCTRGNSSGFIFSFNYSFTLPMTYSINVFQYGNINNLISSINKIYSSAFISLTYVIINYLILFPSNVLLFFVIV